MIQKQCTKKKRNTIKSGYNIWFCFQVVSIHRKPFPQFNFLDNYGQSSSYFQPHLTSFQIVQMSLSKFLAGIMRKIIFFFFFFKVAPASLIFWNVTLWNLTSLYPASNLQELLSFRDSARKLYPSLSVLLLSKCWDSDKCVCTKKKMELV